MKTSTIILGLLGAGAVVAIAMSMGGPTPGKVFEVTPRNKNDLDESDMRFPLIILYYRKGTKAGDAARAELDGFAAADKQGLYLAINIGDLAEFTGGVLDPDQLFTNDVEAVFIYMPGPQQSWSVLRVAPSDVPDINTVIGEWLETARAMPPTALALSRPWPTTNSELVAFLAGG